MREILFRGKCQTGEWVCGGFVSRNGKPEIVECDRADDGDFTFTTQVDPTTVGQFTGLTDKNGKRVFEGDIIAKDVHQKRERIDSDGNIFHVLEIHKPKIQKTAVVEYCSKRGKFHTGTPEICFDFASDFYIIGNIHDNPELLK
jgi:uncharacterized phage protein (TIGR01671 family)